MAGSVSDVPCYHPIPAKQETSGSEVRLWPPLGEGNLSLPCGRCLGCRTARATEWAHRCGHEASQWEHNSFVTLTYADDHVPPQGHLQPEALTNFFKRARKYAHSNGSGLNRDSRAGLRYFACGEYGEETGRPHYHALLFNFGFSDLQPIGKDLYTSETLGKLWKFGQHSIGQASAAAANYIAQYTLKKIGQTDCDADGVVRPAAFARMSLKPAIGSAWLEQFSEDLRHGYLVVNGTRCRIPRTYLNKVEDFDPQLSESIKGRAWEHRARNPSEDSHPDRLVAAEIIHSRRKELTESRAL